MSSPPALSLEDYDAIASAVMETDRGRWFLSEFARRNRSADTAAVLEALAAVEARLSSRADAPSSGTREAARRIAGALEASTRIRALLADADEASAARAFGDLRSVETDLREALRALGAPHAAALVALAAPMTEVAGPEPAKREAAKSEAAKSEAAKLPVAQPARREPLQGEPACAQSRPAATPAPAERRPGSAPGLAAAVVASPAPRPLLDSLSEAEKAILFA